MTNENLGRIGTESEFEGIIYNVENFSGFAYFDAGKETQNGLTEHRTYIYFNGKNLKLLHRSFEDTRFPNRYHPGLNEMIKKN